MAAAVAAVDGGAVKDFNDVKCQFRTREGFYRLLAGSENRRASAAVPPGSAPPSSAVTGSGGGSGPGLVGGSGPGSGALPPVRLSLVRMLQADEELQRDEPDRVCFNLGRELYFYSCQGTRRALDLNKPIDKRIYKGTQPTCHNFNQFNASPESISLLVGFSAGQVQYLDLIKKETSKLFNEERLIDKTKVTYLRWIPESESLFLASHASGHLYLYNVDHPCGSTAPQYTLLKQGEGFAVYACKSKGIRNPLVKWAVGEGALNEFSFSPDGRHLACVGQDGCLRVFHFDSMELQGMMKSYFGGLLCVCWSPDGRYIVTGGEDDLVTVWCFAEGRVIARGHGHKSWVNAVAFDPYTSNVEEEDPVELSGSDEDVNETTHFGRVRTSSTLSRLSKHSAKSSPSVTYRFGSAGQDTQFCLWDLTEDILYPHQPLSRARTLTNTFSASIPPSVSSGSNLATEAAIGQVIPRSLSRSNSLPHPAVTGVNKSHVTDGAPPFSIGKFATLTLQERKDKSTDKEHKRYHSLGNISKSNDKINVLPKSKLDSAKILGTGLCPRINEVPLLEPLVCKKIAHERLTVLLFLEDCIITACQEGFICTWARPGKANASVPNGNSPSGTVV
ncbi:dystrophia myotonica WD repeat-containing protein isoform X1 [Rhinatrema bivittatum]|uniref:dystrophia myotonica WD repeat-containing protein isoform X1 n=1 Tax=Rhinatrema bivittatum TaxID=194408 RepID=UPI00112AEE87|nr:dystrophia myotonica WD repeat-containing protein isoform X1 [Rhinatrema bivittatum]